MRVNNTIIDDERLNISDIGLLIKLMRINPTYYTEKQLTDTLKKNGRTSVRTALKHLIEYGYITRTLEHKNKGKISGCLWSINVPKN